MMADVSANDLVRQHHRRRLPSILHRRSSRPRAPRIHSDMHSQFAIVFTIYAHVKKMGVINSTTNCAAAPDALRSAPMQADGLNSPRRFFYCLAINLDKAAEMLATQRS